MTSVLNFNNSSSSEFAVQEKGTTSILSNAKPTFIIQPPTSTNDSDLLSKRVKNSYLGDLLLKKVKSVTANSSEVNSINQSPTKGLKEAIYDTSDNQSIQEEGSPSLDTVEKLNLLMPQRSLSTPIFSNLQLNKNTNQSSQKQILNALDLLQKRLVEYQVMSLRDAIIKAHLSQGSLMIPTLGFGEEKKAMDVSPVKKIISSLQNDDDELEVYYGEVEYPLLHLAPKGMQVEEINKKVKANKVKGGKNKKAKNLSSCSSPSFEGDKQDDSLLESLTATRAGTQRSEPEMTINLRELSEQVAELIGQANKKSKETGKKNQKKQEKEKKQRGKKQEELLSPVLKGKRMTERKKNRWQAQEEEGLKI